MEQRWLSSPTHCSDNSINIWVHDKSCVVLHGFVCGSQLHRPLNRLTDAFILHYKDYQQKVGATQHVGNNTAVTTEMSKQSSGLAMLPACLTITCNTWFCLGNCPRSIHREILLIGGRTRSGRTYKQLVSLRQNCIIL